MTMQRAIFLRRVVILVIMEGFQLNIGSNGSIRIPTCFAIQKCDRSVFVVFRRLSP